MDKETKGTGSSFLKKKGQYLVFIVVFIAAFEELVFLPVMRAFDIRRLLFTIVLIVLVYEGYSWARILMGIFSGLAGLTSVAVIIEAITLWDVNYDIGSRTGWFLFMLVLYFVMTSILLFSQSAIAFLTHRRAKKKS